MIRFWILAAIATISLFAQDQTAARIDEILQPWTKPGLPGASIAVIRDGKLIFQKGYGLANLEYDIPNTPGTIFHVASVSKQFTAMALVLLEQDGKLSIEDDVHKYLPELPDYGKRITIRNLLQHTSGMRDQWQLVSLAGWRMDDVITQQQLLCVLFHQKELNFAPGSQHLYSNGGYTLAAEIVARVSGKPFPQFCKERIFEPLGMAHTHFHLDHRQIVHDRAYSYERSVIGYQASPLNYANVGATSLFTTASDLATWLDNFREPKVGGKAAIARLEEQAVLSDGKKIDYALGVSVGTLHGNRTVSHSGGDAGFRSYVLWFPDHNVGVVVLSNAGDLNVGSVANKIADIFVEGKAAPPKDPPKKAKRDYITVDPATLAQFAGEYTIDRGGTLSIVVKDGKIFGAPPGQQLLELRPIAPAKFYVEERDAELEFNATPHGLALKISTGNDSGTGIRSVPFDSKDLSEYAGTYWSDELETQYRFFVKEGKLTAEQIHHGEIALSPLVKDQFSSRTWFMAEVKFTRGPDGMVSGVTLGGGRIAGVHFVKK